MKKTIIIICTVFALQSCSQSKEQKAEKLVKLYLDSTLNDSKSYEAIKFEKFDTLMSTAGDDPYYKRLMTSYDSLMLVYQTLESQNNLIIPSEDIVNFHRINDEMTKVIKERKAVLNKRIEFAKNYKSTNAGWKITHTFRAKNAFGALIVKKLYFELNQDLTKVTYQESVKDTLK